MHINFIERQKEQEIAGCQLVWKTRKEPVILLESIGSGGFICLTGNAVFDKCVTAQICIIGRLS
jgi:hypothetical protein